MTTNTTNSSHKARLTFCGGAGKVTGANFLFETLDSKGEPNFRVLVDCGLTQGSSKTDQTNYEPFLYDPAKIDALFVTHAHIDHIGLIPRLVRQGFHGAIYSTAPTRDLAEEMLFDAYKVMKQETQDESHALLYEREDVHAALRHWKTVRYHQELSLKNLSISLFDAGHILGSAMVRVRYGEEAIVFTGDLGNSPSPLLPDTEKLPKARYLIMESVYGDREHENREEREKRFEQVIEETIARGGALLVPVFSLERTQEFLFELNDLVENKKIPSVPIFVDSPLAIRATEVYKKYPEYFNEAVQKLVRGGDDIFSFPRLRLTSSVEESKEINDAPNPKIILAGSGMSNGGRIQHHERRYLPDPKSTLVFVGYQAAGTKGREILDGAKQVRLGHEEVSVHAHIEEIQGYSAHKDSPHLLEFVATGAEYLTKVFVVMGEPKSSFFLAQRIRDNLNISAHVPQQGESVELEF